MAKYKIAWLEGDGIGKDVMEAARFVLEVIDLDAEFVPGDVGWHFWQTEGNALPERTLELFKETDCCLFGAITSKPKDEAANQLADELKDKGFVYSSPIVGIRQALNLHTNMRPCKAFAGNPLNYRDDIDLIVFRENTQGLYAGVEFHPLPEEVMNTLANNHKKMEKFKDTSLDDIAISLRIFTRKGCQTILKSAFEYAKEFGKPTITVVEKPNVIRETSGMMIREARKMHEEDYPDIELWETNVDAMCMWLVKNPDKYGVLVASNMFGDIISDLCGQLVGGLGFAASANLGDNYALFEPTHGSAPKYAGQYKVNPMAMLLATKLMLEWLGEKDKADKLDSAIASTIQEGKARTYDMGGSSSTIEVAKEVASKVV
ncbi:MAG: isocitrate/isopropylmalate dehydrogenase family protein [Thermoplasmata archaeon]|nr:isocitrate/isopropylmalate dehydrogenase family protein [Thermoplasmata archaeon]